MIYLRRCFFQYFLVVALLFVGATFLYFQGFTAKLFIDKTFITWGILALIICTVGQLGIISWQVDNLLQNLKYDLKYNKDNVRKLNDNLLNIYKSLKFSAEMISILPLAGIVGTVVGFIIQAETLAGGTAGLGPLGTSLFATLYGVGGSIIVRLLRFNIDNMLFSVEHDEALQ